MSYCNLIYNIVKIFSGVVVFYRLTSLSQAFIEGNCIKLVQKRIQIKQNKNTS